MSREGYYWRIRDKNLPWPDRVKLVRYAWEHDNVHIPNKHQMLVDWIVYAIGEKKIAVEDRNVIWMCFHDVLHTNKCHTKQHNGQCIKLKSQVLPVLIEQLRIINEDETGKRSPCSPNVIIACCTKILTSPAFGHSVMGLQDGYIFQMLGFVLQICHRRLESTSASKQLNEDLVTLAETLLDKLHYLLSHRPNPKQNYNSMIEKLLEPVLMLIDGSNCQSSAMQQQSNKNTGLGKNCIDKIKKALTNILFHKELQVFYDNFLKMKLKKGSPEKGNVKTLPRFIEGFFIKLENCLKDESKNKAAVTFLPIFYRGFVSSYSGTDANLYSYRMIKYLMKEVIKVNLEDHSKPSPLVKTEENLETILGVLKDLVIVVQETNTYRIDSSEDEADDQLKWYKSLASWILNLEMRPKYWYLCLSTLLDLDHVILEPKLTIVLKKTLLISESLEEAQLNEKEEFIKKLIQLFDKLKQMLKFIIKVINLLKEAETEVHLPSIFLDSIAESITDLPITTMYDVWEVMAKEFGQGLKFQSDIACLFSTVLLSSQLTEHNMSKLCELSNKIWTEHLKSTLHKVVSEENPQSICTCLGLLHSFGEVQILLKYYCPTYNATCPEFFQFVDTDIKANPDVWDADMMNFSYIYPGTEDSIWIKLGCFVEKHPAGLLLPVVKLQIQKLKAIQLFEACDKEPFNHTTTAIKTCLCNVNKVDGSNMKTIKLQIYQCIFDHLYLFNNYKWKSTKQCKNFLKMLEKCGKSMGDCGQFTETEEYHTAYLANVWEEIVDIKDGTNISESSPKRRKKHRKSLTSTANYFVEVLTELQDITPTKKLSDPQRKNLLAAVLTQEALPFESLSEENSAMCICNILSALILLNEPFICSQVELKLVQTCYSQFEAVLTNFHKWDEWLSMSDLHNLLQFLFTFQMRIENKKQSQGKYLVLVDFLLKPLMKCEEGMVCMEVFVAELMEVCRKDTKDGSTVPEVAIATVVVMMKCLYKNMSRSHLPEKVLSFSTKYFECLSAICDLAISKMLQQKQLHMCDASVLDVCSILVVQYCKSLKTEEGEEVAIVNHLQSLCHLCLQTIHTTSVHKDIKGSCVRLIHTLALNYKSLHSHLQEGFIKNSWDSILKLSEQQETKSLCTAHLSMAIEKQLPVNPTRYCASNELNELMKAISECQEDKDRSGSSQQGNARSDIVNECSICSVSANSESSKTPDPSEIKLNRETMEDHETCDELFEIDLQKALGVVICRADITQFKQMLEELQKSLDNPMLENLTEEPENQGENIQDDFKTPVTTRQKSVTCEVGTPKSSSMNSHSAADKIGNVVQSLDFGILDSGIKTEVKTGEEKDIASPGEATDIQSRQKSENVTVNEEMDDGKHDNNSSVKTTKVQIKQESMVITQSKVVGEKVTVDKVKRQESKPSVRQKIVFNTERQYKEEITAVQGARDILSNFYPCKLKYKQLTFRSSGQAYEYQKAIFYGDKTTAGYILFAADASEAKRFAKPLRGGNWDQQKEKVMKEVLEAKVKCVPEFRTALLNAGRIIVEAVKGDKFWSPGLNKHEVKQIPQHRWPGKNIMGKILMDLRDKLFEDNDYESISKNEKTSYCIDKIKSLSTVKMCTDTQTEEYESKVVRDTKPREKVTAFRGENDILSNFYPCKINIWNLEFKSAEHAYYYRKALHVGDFSLGNRVLQSPTAFAAKSLTKNLGVIPSWENNKEKVMREIVDAKLRSVPEFKEALINAGEIIAEAIAGSYFWSAGRDKVQLQKTDPSTWPGQNKFGKMLMCVRDDLIKERTISNSSGANADIASTSTDKKDFNVIPESKVPVFEKPNCDRNTINVEGTTLEECSSSNQKVPLETTEQNVKEQITKSPIKEKIEEQDAGNTEYNCRKRKSDKAQEPTEVKKVKFKEKLTCFHGSEDILSTFYPCCIEMFGQLFRSAQHAYYYKRAVHANRKDLMKSIIEAPTALEVRKLDKEFVFDKKWDKIKGKEMVHVLEQKLQCVPNFRYALLNSGEVIVEANPFDKFWSAGLDKDAVKDVPQNKWPGKNVLGRLLMNLRNKLLKDTDTDLTPESKKPRISGENFRGNQFDGYLTEKVTAFQGAGDVLSNFYACKIHIWDKAFASSEHAYQFQKALFSNRKDSARLIFHSPNALGAKRLAREITTSSSWEANRVRILREIIQAKAECVTEFRQALLTSENLIAEAVPRDRFWSCGLSKDAVRRTPKKYWPGKNVMGELLMELKAQLLQDCDVIQYVDPVTVRIGRTINGLKIWQKLVTYELTKPQWNILGHVIQQVIMKVQQLFLNNLHRSKEETLVYVTALELQASLLAQGPILLTSQSVSTCLHGCIEIPICSQDLDLQMYITLFKSGYSVLNEMLVHHPETVCKCVPSYLAAIKPFLSSVIIKGEQKDLMLQSSEESSVLPCAQLLDRLFTLVCTHKEDFSKVALYIVADYVNEVQKVTLHPAVKKCLLPGIYKLLDLCDQHAIAQLYTVLSAGPREIFKSLHQEYAKYYKYTGKV